MLSVNEFLHVPFSPDLTEGAASHALRMLASQYSRGAADGLNRLRTTIAETAAELAFRRALNAASISYEVQPAAAFAESARYEVIIGGARALVQTNRISGSSLNQHAGVSILQAPALVPSDKYSYASYSDRDCYVFAFVAGDEVPAQPDLGQGTAPGHDQRLTHVLPASLRSPRYWNPLGPLLLKSENDLTLEIIGQDKMRAMITRSVQLPAHSKVELRAPLYSVSALQTAIRPAARIGIRAAALHKTHVIEPDDWGDIALHGTEIILAGCMSRREFRVRARPLPAGSRAFALGRVPYKSHAVQVADLQPLSKLFNSATIHAAEQS